MNHEPPTPPATAPGPAAPTLATAEPAGTLKVAIEDATKTGGTCRTRAREGNHTPMLRKINTVTLDTEPFLEYIPAMDVSETFRVAIKRDGRSLRAIAAAGGLDHAQLSRFLRGERGLTTEALEQLRQALAVEIHLRKPRGNT